MSGAWQKKDAVQNGRHLSAHDDVIYPHQSFRYHADHPNGCLLDESHLDIQQVEDYSCHNQQSSDDYGTNRNDSERLNELDDHIPFSFQ